MKSILDIEPKDIITEPLTSRKFKVLTVSDTSVLLKDLEKKSKHRFTWLTISRHFTVVKED